MMIEVAGDGFVELPLDLVVEGLAAHARPYRLFDDREDAGDRLPRVVLHVRGLPADGQRAAIVREVATERGAEVEDIQLSLLAAAVARRAAPRGTGVIVAGRRCLRLAELLGSRGLQLIEDLELVDAGGDELACPAVHASGGGDRFAQERQLVGLLASTEIEDRRLDIHDL